MMTERFNLQHPLPLQMRWLPLWGSWREAPERASPFTSGSVLALSVTFGDTSPKGRGKSFPEGQRLSLWESWREAPERALVNFLHSA